MATFSHAEDLFHRHLDLNPLRGRRRGLVRCRFHEDRTASLSIDLDRALFNCFGCGAQGGVKRFRELVGEAEPSPSRPARPRSPLAEALARVGWEAERQRRRLDRYRDPYTVADYLRPRLQAVAEVRRIATVRGEGARSWQLLDLAARVETEALAAEAELDEYLPLARPEALDAPLAGGGRP